MPYFSIEPPMPRPWGPSPMMYSLCPPWMGWYSPWTLPQMHFHPGWSGPIEGFGHGGYYKGDCHYESVGHQQDGKAPRQENRTVRNAKPDHPASPKAITASGQQHKQWVPKAVSSADGSGGNQDQTGPRSETSANDEAKHSMEKGLEEIVEKQNKPLGEETEIKAKAVVSPQ
jgi:hypothetical protein